MIALSISSSEWGFLTYLPNMLREAPQKSGTTPDKKHMLTPGLDELLIPGVPDHKLLGQRSPSSGYGYVRPWDETGIPEELALELQWRSDRVPRLDYYVAERNGSPFPDAVGLLYPARVFITAADAEREDLPRHLILEVMSELKLPHHPNMWNPCQILYGMGIGGIPKFHSGLRADTDYGASWYKVSDRMRSNLPEGYTWQSMGDSHGQLYIEE